MSINYRPHFCNIFYPQLEKGPCNVKIVPENKLRLTFVHVLSLLHPKVLSSCVTE